MTEPSPIAQEDFDALLELLDEATMRDVVHLFVASCPDRLTAAREGIGGGDGIAAATAFHTLRSGCGQLGARAMEQLSADAERAAKAGDFPLAGTLLARVESEYAQCLVWFRTGGWLGA